MSKLCFFILILLNTVSCKNSAQSVSKNELFGKVKLITVETYMVELNFDQLKRGAKVSEEIKIYDRNGNLVELKVFDNAQRLSQLLKYEYDETNRMLKWTRFDPNMQIEAVKKISYVSSDLREFVSLKKDGSLQSFTTEEREQKSNKWIQKFYSGRDLLSTTYNTYDKNENLILRQKMTDGLVEEEERTVYLNTTVIESTTEYPKNGTKMILKNLLDSLGNITSTKIWTDNSLTYNMENRYSSFDLHQNWLEKIEIPLLLINGSQTKPIIVQRKISYY